MSSDLVSPLTLSARGALSAAPDYVQLVAEHSHDLVAFADPDGMLLYASPSFRTLLSYEPARLVGQNLLALLHPADLASQLEHWPQGGDAPPVQMTCRIRHADGGWRWLAASLSGLDGYPEHVVFVAQDTTDRRRTELQLARLLRHNDLILNSITEGMFGVDANGAATFINAAAARLLGWEPVQFLGRQAHASVLHTGADGMPVPEHETPLARTLRVGQIQRVTDGVFWRKDGTALPVDYICTPIVQSSAVVGAVVVFQDITERQQLQSRFLQAQKMESIGQLAGSVAHDFNNLLTGIIGYANLAEMLVEAQSPVRESLQEIEKSGYRAAALTRQLLAFARKQVIELRPLLLNDLLTELDKLLRRLTGPDIALELLLDPAVGAVLADSGQLSQVVVNLAVNARDAMQGGGRLTLQTAHVDLDEQDPHRPAHLPPGQYVALVVSDTGVGMTPEVMARIFEPFFTTKEPGAGTGLGLATCYGIVQQHRGGIAVASTVGRGTTFRVYLPPSATGDGLASAADTEAPTLVRGSETLLLAEDDDTVRRLLSSVLQESGYGVVAVADGEQALRHVREQHAPVDLLIADIVMPRMRGTALAQELALLRPSSRVLFISGQIDDEIVEHGQLLPGVHFLAKPFSASDLLRKVRQVLDG